MSTELDYFRDSISSINIHYPILNLPYFSKQNYEFIKQIGHSSLGNVYKNKEIKTQTEYAI